MSVNYVSLATVLRTGCRGGQGGSWDTLLVIIRLERMVALATMRAAKAMRNSQIMDLL